MFLARLCIALGHKSIEETKRLTARELTFWRIVDCLDPIGGVRGDLQAGQIAEAVLARKGRKPAKLGDYVIKGETPSKRRKRRKANKRRDFVSEFANAFGLGVEPSGR